MEPYTNSFHLQTALAFGRNSFSSESTAPREKNKNKLWGTLDLKGASNPIEGTFNEVKEYNKHLLALKDLEELKKQYYDEYLESLERKVLKQRREFAKKKDSVISKKYANQKLHLPKLKKLPYHQLEHDREYLRKVTKSRFYHLLAARNLMEQKGLLKSRSDEEFFWDRALHDNEIWNHPVPGDIPSETVAQIMFNRFSTANRLRRITEHKDRQRVTFSESPSKSFPNAIDPIESDETSSDKLRDTKLIKLQVKMKFPKLHALKKTLPLPPIQAKTPTIQDSDRKLKRLEKFRSIQDSYNIAMVNHAVTKQMMERHGFSVGKESNFLLGDVAASANIAYPLQLTPKERVKLAPSQGKDRQVFITEPVYGNDQVLIPDLEYKYPNENSRTRQRVKVKNDSRNKMESPEKERNINGFTDNKRGSDVQVRSGKKEVANFSLPLNYTMMLAQGDLKVKKAKNLSTMWVNYLNADDNP